MLKMTFTLILMLNLTSCAMNRASSKNLLDQRADIDGKFQIQESINSAPRPNLEIKRTAPLTTDIWVHPHELSNGDYFAGAWIKTLITRSTWTME